MPSNGGIGHLSPSACVPKALRPTIRMPLLPDLLP
jgi:hypothetical protein